MTSRGSPDSTTTLVRLRPPSRTRWLCTAAVARSIGIGARCSSTPRSERTITPWPRRTRREASRHIVSSARSSASPPPAGS